MLPSLSFFLPTVRKEGTHELVMEAEGNGRTCVQCFSSHPTRPMLHTQLLAGLLGCRWQVGWKDKASAAQRMLEHAIENVYTLFSSNGQRQPSNCTTELATANFRIRLPGSRCRSLHAEFGISLVQSWLNVDQNLAKSGRKLAKCWPNQPQLVGA